MEFDSDRLVEEVTMICYFWEGLKLLVKVEIEQRSRKLNRFDKPIEKSINVKVQTSLRLCLYTCKTNQHYAWASCPGTTKSYIQSASMNNFKVKELKIWPQQPQASEQ